MYYPNQILNVNLDRNASASVLCAIGCYVSIFPGYLMLAVFAQCRQVAFQFCLNQLDYREKQRLFLHSLYSLSLSVDSYGAHF